jgi:hypothetical protein
MTDKINPAPIGKPKGEAPPPEAAMPILPDLDRREALAKRLCEAAGYKPEAYFMGRERWTMYVDDAARFITAFDFIKELDDVG